LVFVALALLLPVAGRAQSIQREALGETLSEASRRIASAAMAEARAIRWAQADQQLFVAPLPTLVDGMHVRLILNSRFAEPIPLEIQVTSAEGDLFVVSIEDLEPRGSLEVDLLADVKSAGAQLEPAAVRVSFFGDKEMVQAWLLVSGEAGQLEVPLLSRNDESAWQWTTFWDTRLYREALRLRPRIAFVNTEATPVSLTLDLQNAGGSSKRTVRRIPPLGTYVWNPSVRSLRRPGALRAQHDGAPGQVLPIGYLEGGRFLAALPVLGSSAVAESVVYDSTTLPLGTGNENRPILSLFHPGGEHREPAQVRVAVIEALSGEALGTVKRWLAPEEIQSLDLRPLMPEAFSSPARMLRLQVLSEDGPLLAMGVSLSPAGVATDIALIPRQKVHDSGTYPIPNLEDHQVVSTFLNLGSTEAELFGHLSWADGEYALAPIRVAPGAAVRVDFQELMDRAEPDLQGRIFQPGDSPAYFQWLSRRGSSELIARTEIRPLASADSYGFNCFGCCEEFPAGGIEPGFAAFAVGGSADFVPVEFIDTCSGTIGPYSATPISTSYSSPLGWNYSQVWSGGLTNQMVSFSGDGFYMWVDCEERHRTFVGDAPAVAEDECQEEHNPGFDVGRGCCGIHGADTVACNSCCDKQHMVAICRCNKIPFYRPLARKACQVAANSATKTRCKQPCSAGCGDV
jgi:hypothetical protein